MLQISQGRGQQSSAAAGSKKKNESRPPRCRPALKHRVHATNRCGPLLQGRSACRPATGFCLGAGRYPYRRRQIRDVPRPHLIRRFGRVRCRCCVPLGALTTASMLLLTYRSQDAIKRRLRRQIAPLIGQARHGLARRQVGVLRAVAQIHDCLSLSLAQCIAWRCSWHRRSGIGLDNVCLSPPLQGPQR